MQIQFTKYHGAGNDFILIDDRSLDFPEHDSGLISSMCHRRFGIGADGLILLQNHTDFDFEMKYFNSDGFEGSMCGNGGRCIVHFARELNIISDRCHFMAMDGHHKGSFIGDEISLTLSNVQQVRKWESQYFMDTGSPHLVLFTENIDEVNVIEQGREHRYNKSISDTGCNVNFLEIIGKNSIKIRTYERGVEDETWACGTGSVASALAYSLTSGNSDGENSIRVQTKGGLLKVSFTQSAGLFTNVILQGFATKVFTGDFIV
ncbi:diaminopimelate epimerase [Bacteroidota bacterium]